MIANATIWHIENPQNPSEYCYRWMMTVNYSNTSATIVGEKHYEREQGALSGLNAAAKRFGLKLAGMPRFESRTNLEFIV